jgi:hypothetical protein
VSITDNRTACRHSGAAGPQYAMPFPEPVRCIVAGYLEHRPVVMANALGPDLLRIQCHVRSPGARRDGDHHWLGPQSRCGLSQWWGYQLCAEMETVRNSQSSNRSTTLTRRS